MREPTPPPQGEDTGEPRERVIVHPDGSKECLCGGKHHGRPRSAARPNEGGRFKHRYQRLNLGGKK